MKSENKILIIGSGGHGKVVLDILLMCGRKVGGFLDDDKAKWGKEVNGFKVLGDRSYLKNQKNIEAALGIGDNRIRKNIFDDLNILGINVVQAIHPKAVVSREVKIGRGVAIMPGAVVNPSVVIEDGVVINTAASVDHDCYLGAFAHIWPGAHLAGGVSVGECSYVGMGASVIQNRKIGQYVMIGAGAAVISDVPDHSIYAGVPAHNIKNRKNDVDNFLNRKTVNV